MKKITALILTCILLLFPVACTDTRNETVITDVKDPTLASSGSETLSETSEQVLNRIIVVMDKNKSFEFKDYSPEDFVGIDCLEVIELTSGMRKKAQQMIAEGANAEEINYNQILCLVLKDGDEEVLLSAIEKIKAMEGVQSAGPDRVISLI